MRKISVLTVLAILAIICVASAQAAAKKSEMLGKIFIKSAISEVNGQQFPDAGLEETVQDMKKRPGKFIVVGSESKAGFLLVVVERTAVAGSGIAASKTIFATLSIRDGGTWKPATKLQSGVRNGVWRVAADQVLKKAGDWVKANAGK